MTLDPLPPLEAHKREREYRDPHEYEDWLVQQDCESDEAMEAMWDGIWAATPDHVRRTHWDQRAGIDQRMFGP